MTLFLQNDVHAFRLYTSPACNTLLKWIQEKGYPLQVNVEAVPCGFHYTQAELNSFRKGWDGYYGPYGGNYEDLESCLGYNDPRVINTRPRLGKDDKRPFARPMDQVVCIEGRVSSDKYSLPLDFKAPKGAKDDDFILPLAFESKDIYSMVKYGIYKRNGFDNAYSATKVLIPTLSEKEFACILNSAPKPQYNPLLIEKRVYDTEGGCLDTISHMEKTGVEYYRLSINTLDSDLEENMRAIQTLLQEMEGSYIA
jgi:hypothetical protein